MPDCYCWIAATMAIIATITTIFIIAIKSYCEKRLNLNNGIGKMNKVILKCETLEMLNIY